MPTITRNGRTSRFTHSIHCLASHGCVPIVHFDRSVGVPRFCEVLRGHHGQGPDFIMRIIMTPYELSHRLLLSDANKQTTSLDPRATMEIIRVAILLTPGAPPSRATSKLIALWLRERPIKYHCRLFSRDRKAEPNPPRRARY